MQQSQTVGEAVQQSETVGDAVQQTAIVVPNAIYRGAKFAHSIGTETFGCRNRVLRKWNWSRYRNRRVSNGYRNRDAPTGYRNRLRKDFVLHESPNNQQSKNWPRPRLFIHNMRESNWIGQRSCDLAFHYIERHARKGALLLVDGNLIEWVDEDGYRGEFMYHCNILSYMPLKILMFRGVACTINIKFIKMQPSKIMLIICRRHLLATRSFVRLSSPEIQYLPRTFFTVYWHADVTTPFSNIIIIDFISYFHCSKISSTTEMVWWSQPFDDRATVEEHA